MEDEAIGEQRYRWEKEGEGEEEGRGGGGGRRKRRMMMTMMMMRKRRRKRRRKITAGDACTLSRTMTRLRMVVQSSMMLCGVICRGRWETTQERGYKL
jgi:hypothetical protein